MKSYGWFNPKLDKYKFEGGLVHPDDSSVPGSLSANEIEEGAHHAHYLAMYISIAVATLGILLSWATYIKKAISL